MKGVAAGCRSPLLAFLAVVGVCLGKHSERDAKPDWENATCPGVVNLRGYGEVSIIPSGWKRTFVPDYDTVEPRMDGRAYFADACTAGQYDHKQYLALNLLGKTFRYTTDISGAACGCNAALYLTSMAQNTHESECWDYYCDANNVCGESCAEIDIQEANLHAWHSTLHSSQDHDGLGAGIGGGGAAWNGPRDWTEAEYGPKGKCVDTSEPFDVAVSFPVDELGVMAAMEVTLRQSGRSCPLFLSLEVYKGMEALSAALSKGMTPIVSYWADPDMLWLDGTGKDHRGPCRTEHISRCEDAVRFYNFSIEDYVAAPVTRAPAATTGKKKALWEQWTTSKKPMPVVTTKAPEPVAEDDMCDAYMAEQGCAWTRTFSCPGQEIGEKGLATWDGSRGFDCCCQKELWKEVMGCSADYGAKPGDPVCCGQSGTALSWGHICPKARPYCANFEQGVQWGACKVQRPPDALLVMQTEELELTPTAGRQDIPESMATVAGSAVVLLLLAAIAFIGVRRSSAVSVAVGHNRDFLWLYELPEEETSGALHSLTLHEV